VISGLEEVDHRRWRDDGGEQHNNTSQRLGPELVERRDLLVHRVQKRVRRAEERIERGRVRAEEPARVRRPGGRSALRRAFRDRKVQHRQQDRRELCVHPEEPELPLPGGGRP